MTSLAGCIFFNEFKEQVVTLVAVLYFHRYLRWLEYRWGNMSGLISCLFWHQVSLFSLSVSPTCIPPIVKDYLALRFTIFSLGLVVRVCYALRKVCVMLAHRGFMYNYTTRPPQNQIVLTLPLLYYLLTSSFEVIHTLLLHINYNHCRENIFNTLFAISYRILESSSGKGCFIFAPGTFDWFHISLSNTLIIS